MAETSYPSLMLSAAVGYANVMNSILSNGQTLNMPAISGTDTLMALNLAQTITSVKTFSTAPVMSSITVGAQTLNLPAIASTDVVVTEDFAQTLTGKTLSSANNTVIDANQILTEPIPTLATGYLYYDLTAGAFSWTPSVTSAGPTIWGTGPSVASTGSQTWEESQSGPAVGSTLNANQGQALPNAVADQTKIAVVTGLSEATTDSYILAMEATGTSTTNVVTSNFIIMKGVGATEPTLFTNARNRSDNAIGYPAINYFAAEGLFVRQIAGTGGADTTPVYWNVRLRFAMPRSVTPVAFPSLVFETTMTTV